MTSGLAQLEDRIKRDLSLLSYPQRAWLTPRKTATGEHIYDVIFVGAGQGGLVGAFGLQRERIDNVLVIDENPEGFAGPWLRFARMRTLRTPKYLTGPDLGIPSLTPRAWYEAQHGEGSWEALGLIPKETWASYLNWYRETLAIPTLFETKVGALRWNEGERAWEVPCKTAASESVKFARRVVLATGIEGSGEWHVPAFIRAAIPPHLYAHTRWEIDFDALVGKRVAVLGAGASAFDNAASAIERGAAEVKLYFRRPELVDVNAYRWAEFTGFLKHLGELPDADKYRFISQILKMGQLPPADTLKRAQRHPGFQLMPSSGWQSVALRGDAISIQTTSGQYEADYIIVGTGFITDLSVRPELAQIEQHIARWADRYSPPASERHEDLMRHPYLAANFEFTERTPGSAPYLQYLYNHTFGGLLSLGFGGASISGLKYSIPRLVAGITKSFFFEDRAHYYRTLCDFSEREFST
jgi:cation diffusion facilitator CzcD-associated flavoprotein CzcO